mgnify:CR=1 FL=1|jgi:3'-5' exoribonuclease
MNKLEKKELLVKEEGTYVRGYVLVQSVQVLPTKNGSQYIAGNVQAVGQVPFKMWSNENAFGKLMAQKEVYLGKICRVDAKIDRYGGTTSLIVSDLDPVDATELGLSEVDFLEEVYDINQWWGMLETVLKKYCSEEALSIFNMVISPIKEKFTTEFAAVSHHDNCKSGLLAHTTKVVRLASLLKMYPQVMKRVSPDLLFLACALHDIGKIYEYANGAVSEEGKMISHHTFGVLMLNGMRAKIEEIMGSNFYYQLLAVIEQHHGEWGERPRTVASYVINLIDNLDAKLTSLDSVLAESNGDMVNYDGYKLV